MTAKEIILQDRIDTMAYVLAEICRRQRPDLTCEFSDSWEDFDIVSGLLATRSEEELIEEIAPTPFPPAHGDLAIAMGLPCPSSVLRFYK
jgi:hypothetical protein